MKYLMFIIMLLIISIPCYAQESQENYTLLLLPFEDRSGIDNPLLAAFNDTIDFVLSRQTGPVQVRLIPKPDRDALLARAAAMHSDKTLLDRGLLAAEWADADGLITGSYTKKGTQWSLQAQVYHLREGRKARQEIQIQGDSLYKLLDEFPAHLLKQFNASYIALTTTSWKAYEEFRKGHEALENYNFFGALEYYDKALELDPALALAYAEQSYVYFMTGQPEQATKAIEAAQRCLPKASPMEQLAIRVLDYGWDKKKNEYRIREVINLAPNGVWDEILIHRLIADVYNQEGKQAEADQHHQQWFEAIQRRIRAHPGDASLLHETATYCLSIGQYVDEAIGMELKAVELNPEEYWDGQRYVLSRLHALQGDIEQSLGWARQSIQYLPDPRLDKGESRLRKQEGDYGIVPHSDVWYHLATSMREGRIPPERLIRWCDGVLHIPGLYQPNRVRTQYLIAESYKIMKNDAKVEAMLVSLGAPCESDWMVIGPFDASVGHPFPEIPPFALCTNLTEPHMGILGKEIQLESWVDGEPLDGVLGISQVFNKKYYYGGSSQYYGGIDANFYPSSVAYSCIYVKVPTALNTQVRTGSGLMKVWLNENPQPVVEVNSVWFSILDDELNSVSLKAGLNRFLVATVSGPTAFNFSFRITDSDGNAIPGLKYVSMREVLESR